MPFSDQRLIGVKRVLTSVPAYWLQYVVLVPIALFVSPILARWLGNEEYGL